MPDPAGPDFALLIRQLRRGDAPWQRSFPPGHAVLPVDFTTGIPIPGAGNSLALLQRARRLGYSDNRWGTARQIMLAGGSVRPGEPGTRIVIHPDRIAGTASRHPGRAAFRTILYNVQQTRDLPLPRRPTPPPPGYAHEAVRALYDATRVPLVHSATAPTAYYNLQRDIVVSPSANRFSTPTAYHHALLHQVGAAAGHPTRLALASTRAAHAPNASSVDLAREALRLEIQALRTGERLALGSTPQFPDRFTEEWIDPIPHNPAGMRRAAQDAVEASDYTLDTARDRLTAVNDRFTWPPPAPAPRPPPRRAPDRGSERGGPSR